MSTATGTCPRCKQVNSYAAVSCLDCGARLPWADALEARTMAAAPPPVAAAPMYQPPTVTAAPSADPFHAPPQGGMTSPPVTTPRLTSGTDAQTIRAILRVVGVIFVLGGGRWFVSLLTGSPVSRTGIPTFSAPIVTMSAYNQIQSGMSYDQVKSIIGNPGEQLSHSEVEGYVTVMYSWQNGDGSNMNCMFQNDKEVNKAQFQLP